MKFSRLMLGTVQFGLNYGINNTVGRPSLDTVKAILRAAADGGINVLDTARNYGDSEEVLGIALAESGLDKHFHIVSKVKLFPENLTLEQIPDWISESVNCSLKMLKRETLDGLLLHSEKDLPHFEKLSMALEHNWSRSIGASLDSIAGSPEKYTRQLMMAQVPGNILDRRFFKTASEIKSRGGAVFVRSVYLQGLLFKPADQLSAAFAPLLTVRTKLEKLSKESGILPQELYFRYLLSQDMIDCILTGVDTVEQLQENIRLAERGALSADLLAEIDRIVPALPEELIRPSSWSSLK